MPRTRNPVAIAAGKLILTIQQECGAEMHELRASEAHEVMNRARLLQQAALGGFVDALLAGNTVTDYLGATWLDEHAAMKTGVETFVAALRGHQL